MICPKCNTELPEKSVACFHCGHTFKKKIKRKYIFISLPYTCVTANTRMHDIGFNIGERGGRRIRGGGYWGVSSEEVRDLAAWIDFAEKRGFKKVVLVGHSAGWAAVRRYQSEKQDPRVMGMVLASGSVRVDTQKPDSALLEQANRLVAKGQGDDLLRIPNRRFPSFVSADTYWDTANNYPPEQRDFFGLQTSNPGVTRIHCPLLAFFGTNGDVGTGADLELLKSFVSNRRIINDGEDFLEVFISCLS